VVFDGVAPVWLKKLETKTYVTITGSFSCECIVVHTVYAVEV